MSLDVYSGPLCRYYSGDWETENARVSRESGRQSAAARAESWAFRKPAEALEDIEDWRTVLHQEWRPDLIHGELAWNEGESLPYLTYKIDFEGLYSLIFFLCCLQSPKLARPGTLPVNFEDTQIYAAASREYGASHLATLEAQAYLPSREQFLMSTRDPIGAEMFITSTSRLRDTLDWINSQAWNADRETLDAWLRARLPAETIVEMSADGRLETVLADDRLRSADRLEHAAQYGFAVLDRVLRFSETHNVPIRYDW